MWLSRMVSLVMFARLPRRRRKADTWAGRLALILEGLENRALPSFLAPSNLLVGVGPQAMAVADVNGDGIPDLVVVNYGTSQFTTDGSVSVLLGNSDGSFQNARSIPFGTSPTAVAVGDFNDDGIPDLAVTNGNSAGKVTILWGNGDGSFQRGPDYAVGGFPAAVAATDLNGDGLTDLVVANRTSGTLSVLLGNGDGSFQTAVAYNEGGAPSSMALADVNGDGNLDVVATNYITDTVSVLLGNGDGSFQSPSRFAVGHNPQAVAVADVNGDGVPDLVVANSGRAGLNNEGSVSVLLGNGDGSFQAHVDSELFLDPNSITVADVNADNRPDLIVTTGLPFNTVSVLLGNGDGSFQPARKSSAGNDPDAVGVGPVTGNGPISILVANRGSDDVSVRLVDSDGTLQEAPSYPAGGNAAVAVGDFNGDGIPDLAAAGSGGVSVLLGNGDGSFQNPVHYATGDGASFVVVGDVNGDGIPDLIVANTGSRQGGTTVSVLLGNGDGSFQPPQDYTVGAGPSFLALGDLNGDGIPDLVVVNTPRLMSSTVSVLLGNGDGSFQSPQTIDAGPQPVTVAIGDFNSDGIPDLVVTNQGGVSVLLGNGDGSFQAPQTYTVGGGSAISVAVGDFNGDGDLDVAVSNRPSSGPSVVSMLLGNGDGSFQPPQTYIVGGVPGSVAVADFNGDGNLDLSVSYSGGVSVLLGNGDGSFQPASAYGAGILPNSVAVGDFNGDNFPDLVTVNSDSSVSVLLNAADWPAPAPGARHGAAPRKNPSGGQHVPTARALTVTSADTSGKLPEVLPPEVRNAVATPGPLWELDAPTVQTFFAAVSGNHHRSVGLPSVMDLIHGREAVSWPGTLLSGVWLPDEFLADFAQG